MPYDSFGNYYSVTETPIIKNGVNIGVETKAGESGSAPSYSGSGSSGGSSSPSSTSYSPQDYWIKDGETTQQYYERIAGMRGITYTGLGLLGTDPITSENTKSSEEIPYYDSSKVSNYFYTPPLEMTSSEKTGQALTEELMKLNSSLLGESAYRTEQENAQGISGLTKTKQDLTNQLNMLTSEAAAIPLQLEMEAKGRGITTGVLQRQENDRLRTNTIAALGVSALLQATNGNLTTAYALVDRAVAAKYDPIKEQINITTNNLNLIMNSPAATLEEKNRAQAQLDAQNYQKYALEKQQQEETPFGR